MKLKKQPLSNHISLTIVVLSVVSLIFFSYYPFAYVLNFIAISKYSVFTLLISMAFFLLLLQFFINNTKIDSDILIAFFSYLPFALYSFGSYVVVGDLLGDLYNLRTVTIVNVIFIILAIKCRHHKNLVLKLLLFFSSIYFVFFIRSWILGGIDPSAYAWQDIFDVGNNTHAYQGINFYLGMFSILIFFIATESKKNTLKIIWFTVSSIAFLAMFFIGGRTAIIATICSIIVYSAISLKLSRRLLFSIAIFFAVLGCIVTANYSLIENSLAIKRFQILTDTSSDPSMRIFLFTSAIKLFVSNWKTLLFGSGINSFPVFIGFPSRGMYPHNIFLEVLSEYGIIGTFLFLTPLFYILRLRKKYYKSIFGDNFIEKSIFSIATYSLVKFFFTGGMMYSWTLIFYIFILLPVSSCTENFKIQSII